MGIRDKGLELGDGKKLLNGTMDQGGAHLFRLKFRLPLENKVHFWFFSNRILQEGVLLTFTRRVAGVDVTFTLNGVSDTRLLNGVGEVVDLELDIHNDHEDAHFILWMLTFLASVVLFSWAVSKILAAHRQK